LPAGIKEVAMGLWRRRRAEPEPAIVINADADISPEQLEALRKGLAAATGKPVSEEEAPTPEPAQDQPVYPLPRDEKGRYVSRKRM
jgi:hypothetical protein